MAPTDSRPSDRALSLTRRQERDVYVQLVALIREDMVPTLDALDRLVAEAEVSA